MTIKITSATFSACITSKDGLPADDLPIVALVGRSNVGKSSLINALTGRKELARTSSMPGKTLTINFYCINEMFYLVDLPGYGYAKASKVTRARIQAMMNEFFAECKNLKGVVQVVDIRHKPSPLDIQMHEWIRDQKLNNFAVLTKADKLSNQQAIKMRNTILHDIKNVYTMFYSSKTLAGREEFLDAIEKVISGLEFKASDLKQKRSPRPQQSEDRGPKKGPRPDRPQRTDRGARPPRPPRPENGEAPAAGNAPAVENKPAEGEKKPQNPPRRDNPDRPERTDNAKPAGQGNNNRRRRWKNKKPGTEPRKDTPKTD